MGPQNQEDLDCIDDDMDARLLAFKRQQRRWLHESKYATLPGPETWKRLS
jgi:hypothetical protein